MDYSSQIAGLALVRFQGDPRPHIVLNEGDGTGFFLEASSQGTEVFAINATGTITLGAWNGSTIGIASGGTNATTAAAAANNLLPSQSGKGGDFLTTDGSGTLSWAGVTLGTIEIDNIQTTSTDGLVIENTTAATTLVPNQWSPRLRFRGQGLNVSTSVENDWIIENQVNDLTGNLTFSNNYNGSYHPYLVIPSGQYGGGNYMQFPFNGGYGLDGIQGSPDASSGYGFTYGVMTASGSNSTGTDVFLAAGQATGNAASGNVHIQVSTVGSSGSTVQSLVTVALFSPNEATFSVPIKPGTSSDANAPNNTLFIGSDHSNHLCYKDGTAGVHDFGF